MTTAPLFPVNRESICLCVRSVNSYDRGTEAVACVSELYLHHRWHFQCRYAVGGDEKEIPPTFLPGPWAWRWSGRRAAGRGRSPGWGREALPLWCCHRNTPRRCYPTWWTRWLLLQKTHPQRFKPKTCTQTAVHRDKAKQFFSLFGVAFGVCGWMNARVIVFGVFREFHQRYFQSRRLAFTTTETKKSRHWSGDQNIKIVGN